MTSYAQLLAITLPVFALFGLGVVARKADWMTCEAESSFLKLIVNVLYPCLIFRSVLGNAALRDPALLVSAPALGFASVLLGLGTGYLAGKALRLSVGTGLRTFAFSIAIYNYSYIPIALIDALWGRQTLGVLLVFNLGIEFALWTAGILMLSGLSLREGWHKLVNPVIGSLLAGILLNSLGVTLPSMMMKAIDGLAVCAVPLGLLSAGATLESYVKSPTDLFEPRVSIGGTVLRLGFIPFAFLATARWIPMSADLRDVLIIQGAMPAGMFTLVLAKYYGGQPLVAARTILATTVVGIVLIPFWLRFGLAWACR